MRSKGGAFKRVKARAATGTVSAVAAVSPKSAWAVGSGAGGSYVIHWNGHAWKAVKLPSADASDSFSSVSAVGSTAWLLGSGVSGPVVGRIKGKSFRIKPVKVPTGGSILRIAGASASSVWLGGDISAKHNGQPVNHFLILHGNGTKWSKVSTPAPYPSDSLGAITAAGKKVYAAGTGSGVAATQGIDQHGVVMVLKGKHFKTAHIAKQGKTSSLAWVASSSKTGVAVGTSYNGFLCGPHSAGVVGTPYIVSLHGSSWSAQSSPKLRRAGFTSRAVAMPDAPTC